MLERKIEIINKLGLHARAATKLSNLANRYESRVMISFNDKQVDVKSIISLMLLAATKGSEVTLVTEGNDEQEAMDALCDLINDKFGEGE
ncbi:HPr family phosphocarrier protein [Teredinibacter sp. KSP-S5-2]|uniref:HPr family phosphocarrier protein n=1 Tax=Teredinibacter sp. KSP-S5-2 TaxID=3034506 RepID=UPI002934B330|nr:HPr family phosphocarrier protein [Teredinibacter sp. KSP-S5-2]WNO09584.1 HPr family phosphocarrier protein [Teredinibacter sp. KSP-S5-2]